MVEISIRNVDGLQSGVDVLALKYAQRPYGLDSLALNALQAAGRQLDLPTPGRTWLTDGVLGKTPGKLLFIGVPPLGQFKYEGLREFSRRAFFEVHNRVPQARTIGLTLHGPGYGLDEREAFESQIAGLLDAFSELQGPSVLQQVVFVERSPDRAERLKNWLDASFPPQAAKSITLNALRSSAPQNDRFRTVGFDSDSKAHIFVAMPFKEEFDDVYHYGIQNAVNAAEFLCERADLSDFTGTVMDRVEERIATATLVIAELTEPNPNVYLEVGYAWGRKVPTVLLTRDIKTLPFDVRGQRCIEYKRIKDLEQALTKALSALKQGLLGMSESVASPQLSAATK